MSVLFTCTADALQRRDIACNSRCKSLQKFIILHCQHEIMNVVKLGPTNRQADARSGINGNKQEMDT